MKDYCCGVSTFLYALVGSFFAYVCLNGLSILGLDVFGMHSCIALDDSNSEPVESSYLCAHSDIQVEEDH